MTENLNLIDGIPGAQIVPINRRARVRSPRVHRPRGSPSSWQKFKKALYNPETREIFGRTFQGWCKLGIFYVFFYGCLAVVFAIGINVLFTTLDETEPKLKLHESYIGINPGLGFRPFSIEDGVLISYDLNESSTAEKWVNLLNEFLEPYKKHKSHKPQVCSFKNKPESNSVCLVDIQNFGPCADKQYGYNTSSPCVFIKLNKIFGWIPLFYQEPTEDMPLDLSEAIDKLPVNERQQIWLSCNGEHPVDRENIEGFNYYPRRGFPGYFYPYLNLKNYLSPLIAVEIVNPKPNIIINIECRAWAKNIHYKREKDDRRGSVRFEILITSK